METYNYPLDTPVTAKITSLLRLATLQGRETTPHCNAESGNVKIPQKQQREVPIFLFCS